MSKNGNSLGSFFIGAVLGLVAGMVLAPEKGSKTQKKMGRKSEELKDILGEFTENIGRKVQNAKSDFQAKWLKTKNKVAHKADEIEDELGT